MERKLELHWPKGLLSIPARMMLSLAEKSSGSILRDDWINVFHVCQPVRLRVKCITVTKATLNSLSFFTGDNSPCKETEDIDCKCPQGFSCADRSCTSCKKTECPEGKELVKLGN